VNKDQELKGMYMNKCKCCGRTGFITDPENGICNYCKASKKTPVAEMLDLENNTLKSKENGGASGKSVTTKNAKKKKIVSDSGVV
jgi:hypothetical protein